MTADPALVAISSCQTCGACCDYSPEWPRFSTEEDAALDRIPAKYIDDGLGRMKCDGNRCSALTGKVGTATACAIYDVRPDVCHACEPGDDACNMARVHHGLPEIAAAAPLTAGGAGD